METHFTPPSGGTSALHQPLELARLATEGLLDYLNIVNVVWDAAHRNVISADDGTSGYILARSVERNGRPVVFVFTGEAAEADGADVFLGPERISGSYNGSALASGLAYPTFYKGLFSDLRDILSAQAAAARAASLGVYATDGTQAGFSATTLGVITDDVPILPKLFRRLSDYIVSTGSSIGFKEKLSEAQEPVLDLRTSNFTHFGHLIVQDAGSPRISLACLPEELVFDETIPQPGPVFAEVVGSDNQ